MNGFNYLCRIRSIEFIEIAKLLNVSRQTVNDWSKGRRKIPQKHLKIIAEFLDETDIELLNKTLTKEDKIYLLEREIQRIRNQ